MNDDIGLSADPEDTDDGLSLDKKALSTVQARDLSELAIASRQIANMSETHAFMQSELAARRIIYPEMQNREIVNEFRELRTRLLQTSMGGNFMLMVSSVSPGGGASFTAINLAAAFAFDNTKTALLIDCNLRNPTFEKVFSLDVVHGLTDFLENEDIGIENIIYPSGVARLRVVPAGQRRESVAEFFTSLRMRRFLQTVHDRYPDRFIILDAPSIGESADARILAGLCDYVLLVVPYGESTTNQIQAASEAVGPAKLLGVVMNK